MNIINACLNYAGGIEALLELLRAFESGSIPMQQVEAAWQRLLGR